VQPAPLLSQGEQVLLLVLQWVPSPPVHLLSAFPWPLLEQVVTQRFPEQI
jgi:hypothetical protein